MCHKTCDFQSPRLSVVYPPSIRRLFAVSPPLLFRLFLVTDTVSTVSLSSLCRYIAISQSSPSISTVTVSLTSLPSLQRLCAVFRHRLCRLSPSPLAVGTASALGSRRLTVASRPPRLRARLATAGPLSELPGDGRAGLRSLPGQLGYRRVTDTHESIPGR